MKAIVLKDYGGIDQLELRDVPEPKPAAGEVVVGLAATSVNPIDYKLRSGAARGRRVGAGGGWPAGFRGRPALPRDNERARTRRSLASDR